MTTAGPTTWKVRRHGGRHGDEWHTVFTGSESEARERYRKELEAMRQGGIVLLDPRQFEVMTAWAPRLRSRR